MALPAVRYPWMEITMQDSAQVIDSLRRELAALKRQVASMADTVTAIGHEMPWQDTVRNYGRQAYRMGDELQRTARNNPAITGLVGVAALGAIICLASYASERDSKLLKR